MWIHTEMELGELAREPAWRALAPGDRAIARHAADLPVVSLDTIRPELGVGPAGDPGRVRHVALERASTCVASGRSCGTRPTRWPRGGAR